MNEMVVEKRKKWLQIGILTFFSITILVMTYYLQSIFNPLLLSLLLAYILNPIVNLFERCKIRRSLTIFFIYVILTTLIVLIFILLIPLVGAEISYLYQKTFIGDTYEDLNKNKLWDPGELLVPSGDIDKDGKYQASYLEVSIEWLRQMIKKWNETHPNQQIEWKYILDQITSNKENIKDTGKAFFEFCKGALIAAISAISNVFWLLSYLILLPLYTFFLLKNMNDIRDTIYDYLPGKQKKNIIRILYRIHLAISGFFRGKLIICIIKGILTWAFLAAIGAKYSLIFGVIQAVASIVPFLVLGVGMVPNLILILLDLGLSWPYLLGVCAMYGVIECLEAFVFTPWVMGKETELHPLTIILALLIGGNLFGLFGLIMAIPLCTTLKILGQEFVLPAWQDLSHCTPGQTNLELVPEIIHPKRGSLTEAALPKEEAVPETTSSKTETVPKKDA